MTASATPVPRTLYVHDDLSDDLRALGEDSRGWQLGQALFALLRRDAGRVVVLTLAKQLEGLVAHGDHAPFAAAVGIGRAGVRVAEAVHARTGWFPSIHRVDLWREEDETAPGGRRQAREVSLEVADDGVHVHRRVFLRERRGGEGQTCAPHVDRDVADPDRARQRVEHEAHLAAGSGAQLHEVPRVQAIHQRSGDLPEDRFL